MPSGEETIHVRLNREETEALINDGVNGLGAFFGARAKLRAALDSPSSLRAGNQLTEELTMIALALKNQGVEGVTPERGVEILIEQLSGGLTEEDRERLREIARGEVPFATGAAFLLRLAEGKPSEQVCECCGTPVGATLCRGCANADDCKPSEEPQLVPTVPDGGDPCRYCGALPGEEHTLGCLHRLKEAEPSTPSEQGR